MMHQKSYHDQKLSWEDVVFFITILLTFIHKMKNKNQRLTRWSLILQDLEIKHIKGKDNVLADAFSRCG